jgi:cytidylate kinase
MASGSVAIDGPVASGKTTIGARVARRLGWRFLDTGSMYRAFTWTALSRNVDPNDAEAQSTLAGRIRIRLLSRQGGDRLLVDGQDVTEHLRDPRVERGVSLSSRVPGVRSALVEQQRGIAHEGPVVMVGRDIGTVVLPCAEVKVFLEASVDVRARRRFAEMKARGQGPDLQEVVEGLLRRDMIDTERADSPLRPADDAIRIDTDELTVDEVVETILSLVNGG